MSILYHVYICIEFSWQRPVAENKITSENWKKYIFKLGPMLPPPLDFVNRRGLKNVREWQWSTLRVYHVTLSLQEAVLLVTWATATLGLVRSRVTSPSTLRRTAIALIRDISVRGCSFTARIRSPEQCGVSNEAIWRDHSPMIIMVHIRDLM